MRLTIFVILNLSLIGSYAFVPIRGRVVDMDERAVAGAMISEEGTKNYAYSAVDGTFTLFMSNTDNKIIVSANGYLLVKMDVLSRNGMLIFLEETLFGNNYNLSGYAGFTDFELKNPNKQLETMPYLLGEADINRQLQMLPGVEFGPEGFSNLYVRGGNVDENLMLYNGTPVYNFNHLFGISSIFQRNSIENTMLYKGNMPSHYGGRLSSAILIESDNELAFSGTDGVFEISPLSAGLYFKTVDKNKFYFNLSVRRTWFDQLIPKEVRDNDLNFNFYDIQMNMGFQLQNKDQLEFSFLNTRDLYKISLITPADSNNPEQTRLQLLYKWGNVLGSAKYIHRINNRILSTFSLHLSQYFSNEDFYEETLNTISPGIPTSSEIYKSGIREYIAKSHFSMAILNRESLEFGMNVNTKTYRTGYIEYSAINYPNIEDRFETSGDKTYNPTFEFSAYGDYVRYLNDKMEMTAGMRSTLYINGSFVKPYIQPRLHVNYLIDKVSILKFAYSRHNQFVKLINVGGSADPSNIWVPATEEVQPSASDIMELCYERKLGDEFSFSGSAYYKLLHNIIAVANFFDALNPQNDWQAFTTTGSGSGYGIELMFQKNRGNFTGWLSYVMSKSYREFPDLYTEKFLFDFDRTHMVKMYIAFEVDDHWSFGANYVLGSGQLFTVPIGKFLDSEGILQLQYGALNNFRSQPYNRFDISIIKTRVRGGLNQTWKLYVYNVSRTRNPYSITALFEDSSLSNLRLERAFLRIIPGISYVVKF